MKIFELTPDKALKDALDNAIVVRVSETKTRTAKAYRQSEMPNVKLADEFLTIMHNGAIRTMTYPVGFFKGVLAISLYCKANANNAAKLNRMADMLEQLQRLVENKTYGNFHFRFNPDNVLTPISVNSTTGYATTAVNVEWHTT